MVTDIHRGTLFGATKTLQPVVAKLIATPDAVIRLSPALADAILHFLSKFPDACFGLPFAFAQMDAFAEATARKRAKPRLPKRDGVHCIESGSVLPSATGGIFHSDPVVFGFRLRFFGSLSPIKRAGCVAVRISFTLLDADLRIDFRGRQLGMSEHGLDEANVRPVVVHQRRHRVSKQMTRTTLANLGLIDLASNQQSQSVEIDLLTQLMLSSTLPKRLRFRVQRTIVGLSAEFSHCF